MMIFFSGISRVAHALAHMWVQRNIYKCHSNDKQRGYVNLLNVLKPEKLHRQILNY